MYTNSVCFFSVLQRISEIWSYNFHRTYNIFWKPTILQFAIPRQVIKYKYKPNIIQLGRRSAYWETKDVASAETNSVINNQIIPIWNDSVSFILNSALIDWVTILVLFARSFVWLKVLFYHRRKYFLKRLRRDYPVFSFRITEMFTLHNRVLRTI